MHPIKKEIFSKFYATLTKDIHSKSFFHSKITIDELIQRQSKTLDNIHKLLEEEKFNEAKEILLKIAKKHFALGICEDAVFNGIEIYINLINEYKDKLNLSQKVINKLSDLLRETTFIEYSKSYLQSSLKNLLENEKNNTVNFYDRFLFDSIKLHIINLLNHIEGEHICLDTSECLFSKFINSFSFEVITTRFIDLNITLKVKHNLLHQYISEFLAYNQMKEYEKGLNILQKLCSIIQEIINLYFTISYNFKKNPEKTFYKYVEEKKTTSLFVINIQKDKNSEFIMDKLNDFLTRYYFSFTYNFFIFYKKDNKITIIFNNDYPLFEQKLIEFVEQLKHKAIEDLRFLTLTSPYLHIAKIDFIGTNANDEEIEEIFSFIEEYLKNISSKEIVYFKDFTEESYYLLKKAREKIKLKHLTLQAIEEEKVDIFIHKMFDEDKNIVGGEILARIKGENDYIPAYIFIPVIEKYALMSNLDKIIFKKVFQNIDKIKKITPKLFVNVFPPSLNKAEISENIIKLANKLYKENIQFFLELTEYAITTSKNIYNLLEKSSKLFLAFDDFGTGYTNYELVGELASTKNAKVIKIDGSLVKKMTSSKIHDSIVASISQFANELGMIIVYEFVENEEIFNKLKQLVKKLNIDKQKVFYQGWLFDKAEKI